MPENSNELSVEIVAKIDGLQKGLDEVKKELNDFNTEAEKTAKKSKKIGDSAESANPQLKALAGGLKKLGGDASQVGQKLDGASDLFSKFGKNIGALAPAGAGAIVALGAFAAVVAVAGIALYTNRKAILEYVAGINDITEAFDAAAPQIGKQIGRLSQLTDAYLDSNTSQADKVKIMENLNKEYPTYFGNLKGEAVEVGLVETAYEDQKKAIVALGVIKALEAKKAPIYAKIAALGLRDQVSLIDKVGIALKSAAAGTPVAGLLGDLILGDGVSDLQAELDVIDASIAKVGEDVPDLDLTKKLGLKTFKAPPRKSVSELTGLPTASVLATFTSTSKKAFEAITSLYGGLSTEIKPLPPLVDPAKLTYEQLIYQEHLENLKNETIWFSEQFNDIMRNGVVAGIGGFADAIGNAFATGENVVKAGGQAILGSIGSILQQFGGLVVAAGFASEAFSKMMANPFGGGIAAIAAGAALIAIGAAVKSFAGNLGGGGSKGSSGSSRGVSGSSAAGGYSGGSTARTSSNSGGGGTYVFEIQGTKLVGVIANTLRRNNALGGGLTLSTTPTT